MKRFLFLLLLLVAAFPVAAQQQPPDTVTLTPEQRALQRLRALQRIGTPDTLRADTLAVDSQTVRQSQRAAPSPIERDSIMEALLGISGYIGTEFSGGRARFQADSNRLIMRENAQVSREGNILAADSSITYDEALSLACGYGSPVLTAADMTNPVVSDTVCFNVVKRIGYARGATTQMTQGATWNTRCNATFAGNSLYCHDAMFTDCDEPWPHQHYFFAADEMKIVPGNTLVARNVTLKFRDVPVFWLPFMVQSLSRGRRSGILMPRFGINDIARNSSRYNRRIEDVGFYWAVNDYMGAELALDWFSSNWTALRGSFDYNLPKSFLRGGLTHRQYWADDGSREFTIASSNSWEPNERTNIQLTANYATSSEFTRRRTFDPNELNRQIQSTASINRRFDWGSLSMGANRNQQLGDNTVSMTLPRMGLTVSPLLLFEALPGEERFFSNATWGGSVDFSIAPTTVDAANPNPSAQNRRTTNAAVRHSFGLGALKISQDARFDERRTDGRLVPTDSTPVEVAGIHEQTGGWNTRVDYMVDLIGSTTFTPTVNVRGQFARSEKSGDRTISAPVSMDFGASLGTDVFAIVQRPVGPFQAFRHKLSPGISYSYSPEAKADSLQKALFASGGSLERNTLQFSLSQSFEAKYRDRGDSPTTPSLDRRMPGGDSLAITDSLTQSGDSVNAPRSRERVNTVRLLSLTTSALMYDFVKARETDEGFTTTEIRNDISSDLLSGLQFSITHSLFDVPVGAEDDAVVARRFAPKLTNMQASFSINGNTWLFRLLRLGSGPDSASMTPPQQQQGAITGAGPAVDRTQSEYGLIGTTRRTAPGAPAGQVGSWNANLTYTLTRPRNTDFGREEQMVQSQFTFQPTENWSVSWNTSYSFTESAFSDHNLQLTRRLHDWDANFTFLKAQNGNFAFSFAVHLRANPDIKVDYSQADVRGLQGTQFR